MKNFSVITTIVLLSSSTEESPPVMVTLPDNAIPIGVEVRPAIMPDALFLHCLIPSDEEEVITPNVYEMAWNELYKVFSERLEQDNLDVMDSVLKGVLLELESEKEAKGEAE